MKKLVISLLICVYCFFVGAVDARLVFTNENSIWDGDTFTIDTGNETNTIDLQFGDSLDARIQFDRIDNVFKFNRNINLEGNEIENARLENINAAPTCDVNALGRTYYNVSLESAYVCEKTDIATYGWMDLTLEEAATASKIVTVGTGGNYSTVAAAAAYLNGVTGGIILLTPENHVVSTTIDLQAITLIGSNPDQSVINITGAGVLNIKDTIFQNLTLDIDSGITADSALDVKYDTATTSSVVFDWVNFMIGGSKTLLGSTAGTAPTLVARFSSPSAKSGDAVIIGTKVSAGINTTSSAFVFSSQGGEGALNVNDWDVTIAGSSHVLTTGIITTAPDNTIFAYPDMDLQVAINSLPDGGIVTLLPGVHYISAPVVITNDSVVLQGYGDASIIEASGFSGITATTAAIQLGAVNGTAPVTGVSLKDFKLEVNNTDVHGIRAAGGTDIKVFNVTVEKTAGTSGSAASAKLGILFMDGATTPLVRPVIKNSRIFGAPGRWFTDGIHVSGEGATAGLFGNGNGVQNALVESSSVDYVGETAAAFVHVSDSSLFNNRFSRMGGTGGGSYGVYMGRINRVSVSNNIVSGSLATTSIAMGIESFNIGASPITQNSVFSGNVIDGSANGGVGFGTGFQIGATAGTTVQNNTFQSNMLLGASTATTTAIIGNGNFDNNIIANNVLSGGANPWDTGINIQSALANENVMRGPVFNNVMNPIVDNGTDTKYGVSHHRAIIDPTINNDSGEGYSIGSFWVNTIADTAFVLVDDTSGAAVWKQVDGAGHTQNTDTGTTENTFTLDTDDTAGGVSLVFGTTLNESLAWNNATSAFELSDRIDIADDVTVGGSTETIDSDGGSFVLDGDDAFIADSLGVEGAIYTDSTATKYEFIDIFGCVRGSASAGAIAGGRSSVIRFDAANNSQMRCSIPVPDDWQAGTDINVDIFWSPSDNTAGGLHFDFDYGVFGLTDNIAAGTFTDTDILTELVVASTQTDLYSFDTAIPNADIGGDEMINFRLQRSPGQVTDTYAGDVNIHMIRLSYTGKKLR